MKVELVGEDLPRVMSLPVKKSLTAHLDNNLHEVLLRNDVLAAYDLLQDAWKDDLLIQLEIHAVQLAQTDKVGSNKDAKFLALHFAFLPVARMTLVL